MLAEAAVLPCRHPDLSPHTVHDVPGGTKKHSIIPPVVVIVARVIVVVVVARVVVDDSGVILNDVTHLAHRRAAFDIIGGGCRWGGGCGDSHLCLVFLLLDLCVSDSVAFFLSHRHHLCVEN